MFKNKPHKNLFLNYSVLKLHEMKNYLKYLFKPHINHSIKIINPYSKFIINRQMKTTSCQRYTSQYTHPPFGANPILILFFRSFHKRISRI